MNTNSNNQNQTSFQFGQPSVFGQSAPGFGQATSGQSAPGFGQATSGQSAPGFGQATSGQSAPGFGQATSGQSAPGFGQPSLFGQSAPGFGQATSGQSAPGFGQATSGQSTPGFGHATSGQSAPGFGQATSGQSAPGFGQATSGQSAPGFGQATSGQSAPGFGQATSGQSAPGFGQATSGQSAPGFGQATSGHSTLFGQSSGQSSVQGSVFGQGASAQTPLFGQGASSQSVFGQATVGQVLPFGQIASAQTPLFGQRASSQSSGFGQTSSVQSTLFGQVSGNPPTFGKTASAVAPTFGHGTSGQPPSYQQATAGQNSVYGIAAPGQTNARMHFGQVTEGSVFGQSVGISGKVPLFGETSGKSSVFGQPLTPAPVSSGATTLMNTGNEAADTSVSLRQTFQIPGHKLPTSLAAPASSVTFEQKSGTAAAGSEHNFKPLENTTFKPIFGGVSAADRSQNQGPTAFTFSHPAKSEPGGQAPLGSSAGSGMPGVAQSGVNFFSSADRKRQEEAASPRSLFGSAGSSFSSFVSPSSSVGPSHIGESPGREESLKGMKRKEDLGRPPHKHELPAYDEVSPAAPSDHPPEKRPSRPLRPHGGANLLIRGLYDAMKSQLVSKQRKESNRAGAVQHMDPESDAPGPSQLVPSKAYPAAGLSQQVPARAHPAAMPNQQVPGRGHPAAIPSQPVSGRAHPAAGPSQQVPGRAHPAAGSSQQVPARAHPTAGPSQQVPIRSHPAAGPSQQVSGRVRPAPEEASADIAGPFSKSPLRRARRSDSAESPVPLSPNDATAIQVKNLPKQLNQKHILEKHFNRFGTVQRVYCRPGRKLAIIHFSNHNSAANAKRMGKSLHKDVAIFWQKKKNSPSKKEALSAKKEKQREERESRQSEESSSLQSPVRKALLREPTAGRGSKGSPHKKSLLSMSLQTDTEHCDTVSQGLSFDTAGTSLPPSLSHLIGAVAESAEDKYRLLEQRDKIMRQARVKRTELDQAKVFVGTCPDMCPEKERYMRETRNQLSVYELLPGTDKLDHAAAIKEYSRSSADQEEPLPYELRPTPVLRMTMDYLVTRIMDQGEGNYRDWYDFVWNRTRGIRKDITQQHLCDPVTVSLMEKCTRFHIHCAHQLCEEPLIYFDAKINNENLTKCMQSLKEMYQDLLSRDVSCPSEPEFRAYSVLLNLNKGDILREVQQYCPSVRNSAEVKFAVQAFAALNSTNFVRFFRLVRSASYLSSCILHRYFNQIRRDALRALNVAYTVSTQRATTFPLESMVRLLLFHDADEATEFLTSYGLSVSEGYVELNRSAFLEPEVPAQPRKCAFISQKRHISVGEVVNGAPLPPFSLHLPVCSFNVQNKYTGGSSAAESAARVSQETSVNKSEERGFEPEELTIKRTIVLLPDTQESSPVAAQSVFQPIMLPQRPPSPPKPFFTDEDVVSVMEGLVEDMVREHSAELSRAGFAYVNAALGVSSLLTAELLTDVISEISLSVADKEVRAEKKRVEEEKRRRAEEARLKQERELILARISQTLCIELTEEVLSESVRDVSSTELGHAVQLDHNARIARCSQDVCDHMVDQFMDEEIFQMAKETLREMQCYSKYMQRWREVLAGRKKLRRQMRGFPAAPGCVGPDDKLKALIPSAALTTDPQSLAMGFLDLGHAGTLGVSFTRFQQLRDKLIHEMKVQHFYQQLLCDAAWTPMELPYLIAQNLRSWRECVFWKVVLVLPENSESDDLNGVLSEWLKAKFCWAGAHAVRGATEQRVQTLALYSSLESQEGRAVRVNVCVKVSHGPLTPTEMDRAEAQKELLGTSGLVLLVSAQARGSDGTEEDVRWLSALLQLKQLLQAKPFRPPLPLAVLVPGHCRESVSEVEEGLMLPDLMSSGLISEYVIVPLPDSVNDMQGTDMVSDAVQFLLSHCPRSLELCSLPLRQYIEDGVCRAFSEPFHHDAWERRKAGLPPQDPAAVIDLYNCALRFLAEAASSEQLSDFSWPVAEFTCSGGSSAIPHLGWNCPKHLAWLRQALLSFQIPQMDQPPPGAPWLPVCSMILEYISQICRCPRSLPVLLSEVQLLLCRAYERWSEFEGADTEGQGPPVQDIPWDDLLTLCINHRLRDWEPPLKPHTPGSRDGEVRVYFLQEDLRSFTPPKTWDSARLGTHGDVQGAEDGPPVGWRRSLRTSRVVGSHVAPEETLEENRMLSTEFICTETLTQRLNNSLQAEREESKRFEVKLQQLVMEEPAYQSESLCFPLYLPEAMFGHPETLPNVSDGASCLQAFLSDGAGGVPSLQGFLSDGAGGASFLRRPLSECAAGAPSPRRPLSDDVVCSPFLQGSLTERLHELCTLLKASKEEDIACELHLSTLLDVGDP
ncbi:germinal-center associated nuclear protein isoform X2 [Ascaphus truei]|uniref:germinal-center associated nuclear protein isoform X2 n=1 Tax=Ascaphus truei TaxID=8439 RepID=UPI003F5AB5CB